MTTIAPTFHVQLFPTTFPPFSTITDLEAEKRSFHRQRSTRRLEAARGITTPPFLDLDSKTDIITVTNSPASPRSRAIRRKGQLFNSPTSPVTVSSTDSIESDYLFVNAQVQSDFQLHSPSSSTSSLSLAGNPVANGNSNRGISGKARNKAKTTKTEGPQPLAQPFLLQLRSLPVPPSTATNIKPSNPPVTDNSKSLSPASSRFNMHSTTTTTFSRPHHVLSETEKRRKLAKLIHTFGENIPPELVFPSSTTIPTTSTTSLWKSSSHKTSRSLLAVPSSKPSTPLFSVPDHVVAAAPTLPQSQSTGEPETSVEHQQRRARPRSMTALPSPTMAITPSSRGKSFDRTSPPFQEITATFGPETRGDEISLEWGRRKEKDWSGEWNVKDMDRVAKALRGLKAR